MTKQAIPNNPVVLLQQVLQVLQTIMGQDAEQPTSITALVAMEKNVQESIRIMTTHDKTDAFTIVPKGVVVLCRRLVEDNIQILVDGLARFGPSNEHAATARLKIATYKNILSRLPAVQEPPAEPPAPAAAEPEFKKRCPHCRAPESADAKQGEWQFTCDCYKKTNALTILEKPPGHRSDVKLSAKVSMEVERKVKFTERIITAKTKGVRCGVGVRCGHCGERSKVGETWAIPKQDYINDEPICYGHKSCVEKAIAQAEQKSKGKNE